MFGFDTAAAKQTANGHGGNVLNFADPRPVPVQPGEIVAPDVEVSHVYRWLVRAGAIDMATTPKTDNAIRVNPTVIGLLISLFGVLAVLVPVFIQWGEMKQQQSQSIQRIQKLEEEIQAEKNERIKLDAKLSYIMGVADTHGDKKK